MLKYLHVIMAREFLLASYMGDKVELAKTWLASHLH
jgi:hypothetical protein